ncbi:MAG: peptidoglycan-binding domain-containing protein [Candidatus Nealsonbacteria bacterium]|nr:peptidoglycan-binding domain-containing protein [Candidatus Nealsonbacteria bacterium]
MFHKKILICFFVIVAVFLFFSILKTAEATVDTTGEVFVTAQDGGKTSVMTDEETGASIELLPFAIDSNATLKINLKYRTDPLFSSQISAIPLEKNIIGRYFYSFTAIVWGTEIESFNKPVILNLTYKDNQIETLDELTLSINYWDSISSKWVALASAVDSSNNILTATTTNLNYFRPTATADKISLFTIFGEAKKPESTTTEELVQEKEPEIPPTSQEKPISQMTIEELQKKIIEVLNQVNVLKTQLSEIKVKSIYEGIPDNFAFKNNLKYGQNSEEIKYLQIILKKEIGSPDYPESLSVTNWFGPITRQCVIRFQEKYSFEILKPLFLEKGTGLVGEKTREKLNYLLGK